ncbi:MAG: FIST N-terminal domain-containing protein [Desulfobacteraceae bacterium]
MKIATAYSTESSPEKAALELQSQMSDCDPRGVIFFASSLYDPDAISESMQKAFPQARTFGCSTSGEIVSGKMLKNSIVAMGFTAEAIEDLNLQIVENIQTNGQVEPAFKAFEAHFKEDPFTMGVDEYVGLILVDGLRMAEEKLMDRIGELSNLFFIGGSAGDDLKFSQTWVYADGKAYSDAALLALLKPKGKFSFIKTQSFKPCPLKLMATKVKTAERKVIEFNHKPAAVAYAEAVGTTVDKADQFFMSNPVGLFIDDEPYVRSPQRMEDDAMHFYCNVMEGMEMTLLESSDIIEDTRKAVADKVAGSKISGIINFNCILRTLELEKNGTTQAYADIFADIPTVGFSTYGEEFIGHINQTATMLVFE